MFGFDEYFTNYKIEIRNVDVLFHKCVLKKHIGDFPIGFKFKLVEFSFLKMQLSFYDNRGNLLMKRGFILDDVQMDS